VIVASLIQAIQKKAACFIKRGKKNSLGFCAAVCWIEQIVPVRMSAIRLKKSGYFVNNITAIINIMRRLLPLFLLIGLSCSLFSPATKDLEVVFNTPQIGTPTALIDKYEKKITQTAPQPTLPKLLESPFVFSSTPVDDLVPTDFIVQFHPAAPLLIGDHVSVEVIPDSSLDLDGYSLQVEVDDGTESAPVSAYFSEYGISERFQAMLMWFWDTSELNEGQFTLHFTIHPDGPTWSQQVTLYQKEESPLIPSDSTWKTAILDCCQVHYITGTAVERDLVFLLNMVEQQATLASQRMQVEWDSKAEIYIIPRIWGHGGFASYEIIVSYLDRNYVGSNPEIILHHEMIHILDRQLGGDSRPDMLVEGVAVYQTGGHFKKELLLPRAAALLPPQPGCVKIEAVSHNHLEDGENLICSLGEYIPIDELLEDFYSKQHEIGYIIAGSLVEYMVNRWGWEEFSSFYRGIDSQEEMLPGGSEIPNQAYEEIELGLMKHFGITLEKLEEDFIADLKKEELNVQIVKDVSATIRYYDTARRYQQILDPSAYFATAWSPSVTEMRQRKIVADYLRYPAQMENIVLEIMLASANEYLISAQYQFLDELLLAINQVLDNVIQNVEYPWHSHPLVSTYYDLIESTQIAGYSAQIVDINGDRARVWAYKKAPQLTILDYSLNRYNEWQMLTVIE
jgi:hypothetical protein